ncbi:MAG: hypothetical protein MHM6MM_004603 [Cercozoa sp. M6MM]
MEASYKKRLAELETQEQDARRASHQREKALARMADQLAHAEAKIAQQEQRLCEMTNNREEERNVSAQALQEQRAKAEDRAQTIHSMKEQRKQERQEWRRSEHALNDELFELRARLRHLDAEHSSERERTLHVEQLLAENKAQIAEAQRREVSHREEMRALRDALNEARGANKKLSVDLERANDLQNRHERDIARLEEELHDAETALREARQEITARAAEGEQFKVRLNELLSEMQMANAKAKAAQEAVDTLRQECNEIREEEERQQLGVADLRDELSETSRQLQSTEKRLVLIDERNATLEAQNTALTQRHESDASELQETKTLLRKTLNENDELRVKCDDLEAGAEDAAQLRMAASELARLQESMRSADARVDGTLSALLGRMGERQRRREARFEDAAVQCDLLECLETKLPETTDTPETQPQEAIGSANLPNATPGETSAQITLSLSQLRKLQQRNFFDDSDSESVTSGTSKHSSTSSKPLSISNTKESHVDHTEIGVMVAPSVRSATASQGESFRQYTLSSLCVPSPSPSESTQRPRSVRSEQTRYDAIGSTPVSLKNPSLPSQRSRSSRTFSTLPSEAVSALSHPSGSTRLSHQESSRSLHSRRSHKSAASANSRRSHRSLKKPRERRKVAPSSADLEQSEDALDDFNDNASLHSALSIRSISSSAAGKQ